MLRHRRSQSAPPAISLDKAPPQPGLFRAARPLNGAVTVSTAACGPPSPSTPPPRTPAAAAPAPRTPSPARHLKTSSHMSPPPAPKKQRVGLDNRRGEAQKRKMHDSPTEEGGRARKRRILSSTAEEEMEGEWLAQEEEEDGSAFGSSGGGEAPLVAEVLERRFRLIVEQEGEGEEE